MNANYPYPNVIVRTTVVVLVPITYTGSSKQVGYGWVIRMSQLFSYRVAGSIPGHDNFWKQSGEYAATEACVRMIDGITQASSLNDNAYMPVSFVILRRIIRGVCNS